MAAPMNARPGIFLILWRDFAKRTSRCLDLTPSRSFGVAAGGVTPSQGSSALPAEGDPLASAEVQKVRRISKAMKAYLERATKHEQFMKEQVEDFEIGKRHLANMMGLDADGMTQADVDEAIRYLFPSGLFEKRARPMMKHPEEIFPKQKAAQFAVDGRPFHHLFYSGLPNYYSIMQDIQQRMEALANYEDEKLRRGILAPDPTQAIMLAGSQWIGQLQLQDLVLEKMDEHMYRRFVTLLERLVAHPYSFRERDFIMRYRKEMVAISQTTAVPPLQHTSDGKGYVDTEGKRKRAVAKVRISEGPGKISINGCDLIDYFPDLRHLQEREQVLLPLALTGMLGAVDIIATVTQGGASGQAGAVRLAAARALCSFVDKETVEKMRLAGLLTNDPRRKERMKPGREKARKKYTWKAR